MVDDVVTNPAVAAGMGALEPRHFLSAGLGALPSDGNGVPFTAAGADARCSVALRARRRRARRVRAGCRGKPLA
jgi:hypothetical protein